MRRFLLPTILLLISPQSSPAATTQPATYAPKQLAAAITTAQSQFTDLSFHFTETNADFNPDTQKPEGTVTYEATYKQKPAGKMQFIDYHMTARDKDDNPLPTSNNFQEEIRDGCISFDGSATLTLNRTPKHTDHPRADITPRPEKGIFPQRPDLPPQRPHKMVLRHPLRNPPPRSPKQLPHFHRRKNRPPQHHKNRRLQFVDDLPNLARPRPQLPPHQGKIPIQKHPG